MEEASGDDERRRATLVLGLGAIKALSCCVLRRVFCTERAMISHVGGGLDDPVRYQVRDLLSGHEYPKMVATTEK